MPPNTPSDLRELTRRRPDLETPPVGLLGGVSLLGGDSCDGGRSNDHVVVCDGVGDDCGQVDVAHRPRQLAGGTVEQVRHGVAGGSVDMEPDQCRLALAHELGHLVLRTTGNYSSESEADQFASVLLFPDNEFDAAMT